MHEITLELAPLSPAGEGERWVGFFVHAPWQLYGKHYTV
jgi:hypothetical protein